MPIGAAVATAVGAVGGAAIGSSSQKKAAKTAANAQQGATQAQLELGNKSLALQEQMFNQGLDFNKMQAGVSYDVLSPFVGSGLGATNSLNALLGITPVSMGANPYNTPQAAAVPPAPVNSPAGGNALAPPISGPSGASLAAYIQNHF